MSHRQTYGSDIPPYVGESGEVNELQDGEEDEAMEEIVDEQGYGELSNLLILMWTFPKCPQEIRLQFTSNIEVESSMAYCLTSASRRPMRPYALLRVSLLSDSA